tara:strand:- start:140 stop:502 length:363 start_codon:yes stop_codon:yes gene_type:complete
MTEKYDNDNIFARILRKEIKSDIVYENEHTLCFKDAFPKAPVHILIIPKKNFIDIFDFSINANLEQKNAIFESFKKLIAKFNLSKNGCRLITNFGLDGGQEVPHLHFHLLGGKNLGRMIN